MERSIVAFSTRYWFEKAWSAKVTPSRLSALAKATEKKELIERIRTQRWLQSIIRGTEKLAIGTSFDPHPSGTWTQRC